MVCVHALAQPSPDGDLGTLFFYQKKKPYTYHTQKKEKALRV